jgi:predicted TIM-barrel fold metal-dependent hydrolase
MELGASWVPGMLRRLDFATENWAKTEPELRAFTRKPSEQVREQLAFTPYPFEDVAALIDESYDDIYVFSSDYPHVEGSRDPIGKFDKHIATLPETVRERFYWRNFLKIYPSVSPLVAAVA